ncbi:MAG: Flp family type IVb pilin [Deltaproteobacteria bacterium]|nr:Flp family type IVb pilin [Deltaproteobacteria bacterium]
MKAFQKFLSLLKDESGISSVEYALLLALIGSTIAAAAVLLGTQVATNINDAVTDLQGSGTP